MRYYKTIENGYIVRIGTGYGGEEITEKEYAEILACIQAKPDHAPGFRRRIKADLTYEWEELPEETPEPGEEVTTEERLVALEDAMLAIMEVQNA